MKVLLSAYACEPNRGSESEVGWSWALELAKSGVTVYVITRANNKEQIETARASFKYADNLTFIYYDLPRRYSWWKKGSRGVYLYYLLWQWNAASLAKKIHFKENFDRVHHVTFVTVRQPSFMGRLGIPFILGPIAGGERAPWRLRLSFSFKGFVKDLLRDIANILVRFDPMMHYSFSKAHAIYVTSRETKDVIPKRYHPKVQVELAIGFDTSCLKRLQPSHNASSSAFKILYVGRFTYFKGMDLGIRAFAKVLKTNPEAQLTLVGHGEEEQRWQDLAIKLKISNNVTWVPWLSQQQLSEVYQQHNIFLFPSLHDSGGLVVLEALSWGLPIICLDLGGPGVIVESTCGEKIQVIGMSRATVVNNLANALISINNDKDRFVEMTKNKNTSYCFKTKIKNIYGID